MRLTFIGWIIEHGTTNFGMHKGRYQKYRGYFVSADTAIYGHTFKSGDANKYRVLTGYSGKMTPQYQR